MDAEKRIIAREHVSGFGLSDSNFYSLNVLSDGKVYYTLCSHNIDTHGRIYRYDPENGTVKLFADLGVITGETGKKMLPHGKSHSPIFEADGKIYFATHYGFYQGNDGKEEPAPPPAGYKPYPGGKIIEYDKTAGRFRILAEAPAEEGIITMNMDIERRVIYCLTWPKGIFMYYEIDRQRLTTIGQVSKGGEVGLGDNYFCLCRDFAIDPRNGTVYFTNPDGEILKFSRDTGILEGIDWAHMRKDVFGFLDPHKGGHQGYNWRKMLWNPKYEKFFGVHAKSGYLFLFDPGNERMEILDRICSEYCRKNGLYEFFRYGYLTLTMAPGDFDTLYYISGFYKFINPDSKQRKIEMQQGSYDQSEKSYEEIMSYITLTTYHIPSGTYTDHGVVQLEDGRYPSLTQSIAIHPDGRIYTCPWLPKSNMKSGDPKKQYCDLISFDKPSGIKTFQRQ